MPSPFRMTQIALVAMLATPAVLVAAESGEITFHGDIEPILQANCQICHRPGGAGPMPLMTYEQVAPFAGLIEYKTGLRDVAGAMPPWYIEKDIGIQDYKDDMSLSDEEIATISTWARSGSPQGDPADAPAPLVFDDSVKWTLGEPDLIVVMPEVSMKAGAPDWWGTLDPVPTGLTEDRYVKSLEMVEVNDVDMTQVAGVVGGRYIVHHMAIHSAVVTEGGNIQRNAFDTPWPIHEVGRNGDVFDPLAGPLLQANTFMYSGTMHLHSTGQDTTGHIELGFRFHEKDYEPKYRQSRSLLGSGQDISVRPNEDNQLLHSYKVLNSPTKIIRFEPHLHAPGKRMCLEAIWGSFIETLTCAGYDHNWVRSYVYEDHAAPLLPAGTILHVYGEMNVTASNINVPDIRNWSGSGNRSVSNMFAELGEHVELTEEQFQQEMAERREALDLGPNDHVIGCPLCTLPLVSPTRANEDTNVDTGYVVIAEILSRMNQSPSEEDKRALVALTNDSNNRLVIILAEIVANIDGVASDEDKALIRNIIRRNESTAPRGVIAVPAPALAIAEAALGFNQVVSAEDKAALETIGEGTQ